MEIFSKKGNFDRLHKRLLLLFHCYSVLVITKHRNSFQQGKCDGLCKHFFDLIQFSLFTTLDSHNKIKTHWYQHLVMDQLKLIT